MLQKAVLVAMIAAASAYGGSELIDALKPAAEQVTAEASIKNVMNWALIQENLLELPRHEALEQAVLKSTDAEGIVIDGEAVEYQVVDTCLRGEFTEYDTIVISPC